MPKLGNNQRAGGGGHVGGNKPAPSPGHLAPNQPAPAPGGGGGGNGGGGGGPQEVWNPGVPTPKVDPFLTAEDLMAYAQARQQYEEGLLGLDQNYESQVINTGYEKEGIEKGRVKGRNESTEDAAGRGLFRSSIRDADLFDIDATAAMRSTFLDTQLNALKINTEAQKNTMAANWGRYQEGVNKKMVENAEGVQANMPAWQVEPHMEKVGGAPPEPPKSQSKPKFEQNKGIVGPGEARKNTPIPGTSGGVEAPVNSGKKKNSPGSVSAAKSVMGKLYG